MITWEEFDSKYRPVSHISNSTQYVSWLAIFSPNDMIFNVLLAKLTFSNHFIISIDSLQIWERTKDEFNALFHRTACIFRYWFLVMINHFHGRRDTLVQFYKHSKSIQTITNVESKSHEEVQNMDFPAENVHWFYSGSPIGGSSVFTEAWPSHIPRTVSLFFLSTFPTPQLGFACPWCTNEKWFDPCSFMKKEQKFFWNVQEKESLLMRKIIGMWSVIHFQKFHI